MVMNSSATESEVERQNGARTITNTILLAGAIGTSAGVYEYVLARNTGMLTLVYEGFILFVIAFLSGLILASKAGYISRSAKTISLIFTGIAVILLSLFAYTMLIADTPDVANRHVTWLIAILIVPFLTIDRIYARRLGIGLWCATTFLILLHFLQVGANPLSDPGCADLVIFSMTQAAALLLLDGFAMFREAAIKFHARTDVLEETASAMKQAVEQAEAARTEAEKNIKLRETFLATMSHELRTPLNAIIGFSEVIKSDALGNRAIDQYRSYATDIHQSGEHVLGLINQLLDYSRIQSGTFDMAMSPISIADVANQVHRMMTPIAQKKGVTLLPEWDEDADLVALADRPALIQIAVNLIGNALKFTEQGGIVRLAVSMGPQRSIVMQVKDSGPGIPPEKLSEVQKPFIRLGDASLASEPGTGLGLAIVTTLSSAMGAGFSMSSELGEGTTCRVELKAYIAAEIA
jgi:two-component system, cell cycle sensor histidine kinase PleC